MVQVEETGYSNRKIDSEIESLTNDALFGSKYVRIHSMNKINFLMELLGTEEY